MQVEDEDEGEEEEADPVVVLTDILVSLLSRSSALMRDIVMQAFRAFSPLLTEVVLLNESCLARC